MARSSDIITDSIDTLGILAGAFTDGSISLFIVPDPVATRELHATAEGDPLYRTSLGTAQRLCFADRACVMRSSPCLASSTTDAPRHELLGASVGQSRDNRCSMQQRCVIDTEVFSPPLIRSSCSGKVAVWDVGSALRTGAGTGASATCRLIIPLDWTQLLHACSSHSAALPIQYFSVHSATIRSIAFIRVPPPNLEDEDNPGVDTDQEPTALVTTGYDGSVFLVDLRDPGSPYHLTHERGAHASSHPPSNITDCDFL